LATVKFSPFEVSVQEDAEETLLAVAQRMGLTDVQCCGMNPLCGKCKISVLDGENGLSEIHTKERRYLEKEGCLPYERLGCLARVLSEEKNKIWIEMEEFIKNYGGTQCQKENL